MAEGRVQAIKAPSRLWKKEAFEAWLDKQGHKAQTIALDGEAYFVATIEPREKFARLREKESGRGVIFIVGYGEKPSPQDPTTTPWYDRDIGESIKEFFGVA